MARRGILSHKLRRFFERQIWQAMQVARQIALSTKVASRAYGAPFAKNLPLRSGFSGLLRLPPQSLNTQNSSAATPRPGAFFCKNLSIRYCSKESKKRKLGIWLFPPKAKKHNYNSCLLWLCFMLVYFLIFILVELLSLLVVYNYLY